MQQMSNSTSAFIINPQSVIHSTDEQRIRISGSAMGYGSELYFCHTIAIIHCSDFQVFIGVTNYKYHGVNYYINTMIDRFLSLTV